ncbi:MAG: NAD(P)/FAD-dependent oxidoreductase [Firmicutes bacterium]|nr:NAD(P)/FAD-dependent oxidoreductase [Bacillota bacterium]
MVDAPKGAFIQRDKETYAIVPRTPLGLVNPDTLETIAKTARKYEIPIIKITSGQRMALVGLKPEIIDDVWNDLGNDIGRAVELCMHYVQACPGTAVCKFGLQDSLGLGGKLDQTFIGMELPAKAKIGVSGCPMNCAEGYVRDVGIFGKKSGWTIVFGGNSGGRPRIGDVLAEGLKEDEVIELVNKCLQYYKENAKKKERTARFLDRVGVEEFKKAVL